MSLREIWSFLSEADPAGWRTRRRQFSPEPARKVRRRSPTPKQRRQRHCDSCRCSGHEPSRKHKTARRQHYVVISDDEEEDVRSRSPDVFAVRMPRSSVPRSSVVPLTVIPSLTTAMRPAFEVSSRRSWEDDSDSTDTETADEFELPLAATPLRKSDPWKGRVFAPEKVTVLSEIPCGICLEPTAVGKQSVLTPCEHSFCFHCLKQWEIAQTNKAHAQKDDSIVFNCPTCRKKI